ncbi:hypothetical protein UFOVP410_125 [uncultured Caudovirales phage]|uniref:Uncharacterized protein n=1 Tax=uncultured Caudovirales phage TaxID=2100421 RepID=A0A6J5M872_9CAUD|nr:hypothetical protein UFOVP410_125 [uncultured Caudovirales phage]
MNISTFILLVLFFYCVFRQANQLLCLMQNTPTLTVKTAIQTIIFIPILYLFIPNLDLKTLSIMVFLFAFKVMFSSAILAYTLSQALYWQSQTNDIHWSAIVEGVFGYLYWCLPEELRQIFVILTFSWIVISTIVKKMLAL